MDRNVVTLHHLDPDMQQWIREKAEERSNHEGRSTFFYVILNELLVAGKDEWQRLEAESRKQGVTVRHLLQLKERETQEAQERDSVGSSK